MEKDAFKRYTDFLTRMVFLMGKYIVYSIRFQSYHEIHTLTYESSLERGGFGNNVILNRDAFVEESSETSGIEPAV